MNEDKLEGRVEKYFAKGKWEKALRALYALREKKPADLRLRLKIAETLLRVDKPDEARILFRQVADLYVRDGQLHKAIAINHRLLELDRDDRDLQIKLASLYEQHGKGLQKELPLAPDEIHQRVTALCTEDVHERLAVLRTKIAQATMRSAWKEALEESVRFCRLAPTDLEGRLTLARILAAMGRAEEAAMILLHIAHQALRDGNCLGAILIQAKLSNADMPETLQNRRRELIKKIAMVFGRYEERTPRNGSWRSLLSFRVRSEIMEEVLDDLLIDPIDLGKVKPVPVITEIPRRECAALIEKLRPVYRLKGQAIFHPGETTRAIYWICQGTIGLYAQGGKDLPTQMNPHKTLKEGEILGGFDFLFDARHRESAFALEDVEILELQLEDYQKLTEAYPILREQFDHLYRQWVLPEILRTNPLFMQFPEKITVQLCERFTSLRYEEGSFEMKEGQLTENLYLLREGLIDVFCGNLFRDRPLTTLSPGALLSEREWLAGSVLPFTYRSSGPVTLMALSRSHLPEELGQDPSQRRSVEEILRTTLVQPGRFTPFIQGVRTGAHHFGEND